MNLSQEHVSTYLNSYPKISFLFKEYLHLLTDNPIHSCIHTIYPFQIHPQLPSSTFMTSLKSVHLVFSACTWAWCHLLEQGQLSSSHTPEEQTILPLPVAITCWLLLKLGVELHEFFPHPYKNADWLSLVQVKAIFYDFLNAIVMSYP